MIYLKTELENGEQVKIDLYGNEFYATCPKCGKEVHLDRDMLKNLINGDCDFATTGFYCDKCNTQEYITTVFTESTRENSDILTSIFKEVKDKSLRNKLFDALDIYNQMIFNDLDDIYVPKID